MILSFTLSMPGRSSWNGRWSGETRRYVWMVDSIVMTGKITSPSTPRKETP